MVVGTGFDVTSVARVARLVRDHAATLDRIFTPQERAYCTGGPARRHDARYGNAARPEKSGSIRLIWRPESECAAEPRGSENTFDAFGIQQDWRTARQAALDELEAAHRSTGGTGRV